MVKGLNFGRMVLDMKDNGEMTKLIDLEDLYMQMVIFTKANGKTIKPTAKAPTLTLMGPDTKGTGRMTSSMGSVLRPGLMAQCMRDNTSRARKTGRAS